MTSFTWINMMSSYRLRALFLGAWMMIASIMGWTIDRAQRIIETCIARSSTVAAVGRNRAKSNHKVAGKNP